MRSSHNMALGFSITLAVLSQGCAQIVAIDQDYILDDDVDAAGGAGGSSSSSVGAVVSSGAGVGGQGQGGSSSTGGLNPCGSAIAGLIKDDFDDGIPEPLWASYSPEPTHAKAFAADGKLKVTSDGFVASGSSETFAGYKSTGDPFSLINCQVAVQVGDISINGGMAVRVELIDDSDALAVKTLRFSVVASSLIFHDYPNGDGTAGDPNQLNIPYDPSAHAWLRFRESNGEIFSETSPDGKTWEPQYSIVTPAFAKTVRVNLTMGSKLSMQATGSVTFDNVNNPPL